MTIHSSVMDGRSDDLSLDVVYDLLGDHQRRRLLALLHESGEPLELQTLAHRLADERGDSKGADRVDARLYHCHVPKCTMAGMAHYDEEADTLALTEDGEKLVAALSQ